MNIEEYNTSIKEAGLNARKSAEEALGNEPLNKGGCTVRLQAVVELGLQKSSNPEWNDKFERRLSFEVCSKAHNTGKAGELNHRLLHLYVPVATTFSPKTLESRLLSALDYNKDKGNVTDHLGQPFKGVIKHVVKDGRVLEKLRVSPDDYEFSAPINEDLETGEVSILNVPELLRKPLMFLWENPYMPDGMYLEAWNSLYVEGVYKDGNSKNTLQNIIKGGLQFKGSRLENLIEDAKSNFKPF